jgi:hypothetical protein
MKPIPFNSQPDSRINPICETIIVERLGDISDIPPELVKVVFQVYGEFIASYLNVLRQKEGKPPGWFPEPLSIDPVLVDDMRHFFSDYQHITNAFLTLNKQIDELREIDKNKAPDLFEHAVACILDTVPK